MVHIVYIDLSLPIFQPYDSDWPRLSEKDQKFIDDVSNMMTDAGLFTVHNDNDDELAQEIDKVRELEKYVKSKEGYVFDSGAVFREASSFHILTVEAYIKAYDSYGECDKVYELMPEFISMINDDYQIVELFTGETTDPEMETSEEYYEKKIDEDAFLISLLRDLKCKSCGIQPHPYWRLKGSCNPGAPPDEPGVD